MLWRDYKVWQVFGANTDVGKSVFSTLLCKALARRVTVQKDRRGILYLKPVSTGATKDHDHLRILRYAKGIVAKNIVAYDEPISPHLASLNTVR